MIRISKYSKITVAFLVVLTLMQSCIIIKRKVTIEKAAGRENTRITVIKKNGVQYKLRWIEEKDGSIYTIKGTRRVFIDKSKLPTWPNPDNLFKIEDKGTYLSGLKMTKRDTISITIPIEDVETIRITARGITIPLNIVGWGMFSVAAGYGLFVALWYISDSSI